jgi:hypothetical protein
VVEVAAYSVSEILMFRILWVISKKPDKILRSDSVNASGEPVVADWDEDA